MGDYIEYIYIFDDIIRSEMKKREGSARNKNRKNRSEVYREYRSSYTIPHSE